MRTIAAAVLLTALAFAAFADMTDGFRVVTSESARRLAVVSRPAGIADAALVDSTETVRSLHGDLAGDGRVAIVDFIYTRCESICTVLGSEFQQLQREIVAQGVQDRVRLLTISFDPAHDRPQALARYARQLAAEPSVWRFATAADERELAPLLASFGIVVIPDGLGGYVHNAALHVVTADGRLARILDPGEFRQALHDAVGLGTGAGG